MLNVALFGITARQWRDANPKAEGNIRDQANGAQLVCLSNLESLNAELIKAGMPQGTRLKNLNRVAIEQMKLLAGDVDIKRLRGDKIGMGAAPRLSRITSLAPAKNRCGNRPRGVLERVCITMCSPHWTSQKSGTRP